MVSKNKRIVGTTHMNDPRSWLPGSLMVYDNSMWVKVDTGIEPFSGIGLIVANDGMYIKVLWGANCKHVFREYSVASLNTTVIHRVVE
jgi:hypothetical protein